MDHGTASGSRLTRQDGGDAAKSRDPHDGDCSDWVAFARDKPAQWKMRVKRDAKASILSVEAFPSLASLSNPRRCKHAWTVAKCAVALVA